MRDMTRAVSRDFETSNFETCDFVTREFLTHDFVTRDFVTRDFMTRNTVQVAKKVGLTLSVKLARNVLILVKCHEVRFSVLVHAQFFKVFHRDFRQQLCQC